MSNEYPFLPSSRKHSHFEVFLKLMFWGFVEVCFNF